MGTISVKPIASRPIYQSWRKPTKQVGVDNGDISLGHHVTALSIPQLFPAAIKADTFDDFPHSLMSVGKTADAGTVSIFTKHGVTVHDE